MISANLFKLLQNNFSFPTQSQSIENGNEYNKNLLIGDGKV